LVIAWFQGKIGYWGGHPRPSRAVRARLPLAPRLLSTRGQAPTRARRTGSPWTGFVIPALTSRNVRAVPRCRESVRRASGRQGQAAARWPPASLDRSCAQRS